MVKLDNVNNREILYCKIRNDENWSNELPVGKWLAFIIADEPDLELLKNAIRQCLAKDVCYTCNTGQLAEIGHDLFDEEIIANKVFSGDNRYNKPSMTTWHNNFGEGFWFAITTAYDDRFDILKVICLDFTSSGVKEHLKDLTRKIGMEWLPSD